MRILLLLLTATLVLTGCFTIDDSKYEKLYKGKIDSMTQIETANSELQTDIKESAISKQGTVSNAPTVVATATVLETRALKPETKAKREIDVRDLTIRSDNMKFNRESSIAIFRDNVTIETSGVLVTADELKSKDYKESAEATGNVKAHYDVYGIDITCKEMIYSEGMTKIIARKKVKVTKVLPDGNTMNMYADEVYFETGASIITAKKKKKRVKIKLKDMMVFSDKVVYNEENQELLVTGNPVFKKKGSMFLSKTAKIDVNTQTVRLDEEIWSKIYYQEFEDAEREVKSGTTKE